MSLRDIWEREVDRLVQEHEKWLERMAQRRQQRTAESRQQQEPHSQDSSSSSSQPSLSNLGWLLLGQAAVWGVSAGVSYYYMTTTTSRPRSSVSRHRSNSFWRKTDVAGGRHRTLSWFDGAAFRTSIERASQTLRDLPQTIIQSIHDLPQTLMDAVEAGVPLWFYLTPIYCRSISAAFIWTAMGCAVLGWNEVDDGDGSSSNADLNDTTPKTRNTTAFDFFDTTQPLMPPASNHPSSGNQRTLEVMVHNVSHTDMVLNLKTATTTKTTADGDTEDEEFCFCRPRFSCVDLYSRLIRDHQQKQQGDSKSSVATRMVRLPRHERSEQAPRFSIEPESTDSWVAGIALQPEPPLQADLKQVKIRGVDKPRVWSNNDNNSSSLTIQHVFYPLIATLLPRWRQVLSNKGLSVQNNPNCKRVLILVSGEGTPRTASHDIHGNSTRICAELVRDFVRKVDPELTVVLLHDDTGNVFRYDENLVFVKEHLLPLLDRYRDAHALGLPYPDERGGIDDNVTKLMPTQEFDTQWRNTMSVALSFADGTPARTYAIQSSLRPYRPRYYHFWQLKTFWHEAKLVDSDIEVHSFEEMDASPAIAVDKVTDDWQRQTIAEIQRFRDEMVATLHGDNDLQRFWLRKTHKPVLAVLLIRLPETGEIQMYRGTNMEVSMPTGSLCAERNVIGSALADHPNLRRQDLIMIAVLAVPVHKQVLPVPPQGSNSSSNDASFSSDMKHNLSTTSLASLAEEPVPAYHSNRRKTSIGSEQEEWVISPPLSAPASGVASKPDAELNSYDVLTGTEEQQELLRRQQPPSQPSTPVRHVSLFSRSARKSKRTVVIQSTRDLNPLAPCGACNEWLKKISESNPSFTVLTFTDADCHGVYCTPCQE